MHTELIPRSLELFSHGIATLSLRSTVTDSATLSLTIPKRHINDLLKSLTVVDQADGTIASISYPAPHHTPPSNFSIDNSSAIHSLLGRTQGAHVTISYGFQGTRSGKILVVQTIHDQSTHTSDELIPASDEHIILLGDDFKVTNHKIHSTTCVVYTDSGLQKVLSRTLLASTDMLHGEENKQILIHAKGKGEREVVASYVVESPVCKFTYRFLLQGDKVFVQAWAIIDNPYGCDLDDIDVTIVSGMPISFKHDLYTSRFMQPPEEGGVASSEEDDDDDLENFPMVTKPISETNIPPADTNEVGDLFEYHIPNKVTIKERESAVVASINQLVDGGRVDIFSHNVMKTNTLSSARIKNITHTTFEAGPVSVFEKTLLVGEGMMKACRPGAEQFMLYGVIMMKKDIGRVHVITSVAVRGSICTRRSHDIATNYIFRNLKAESIDLHMLHELNKMYSLKCANVEVWHSLTGAGSTAFMKDAKVDIDPEESKDAVARYRVSLPAGSRTALSVTERRGHETSVLIRNCCTPHKVAAMLEQGAITKDMAKRMQEIMKVQEEMKNEKNNAAKLWIKGNFPFIYSFAARVF